MRFSIMSVLQDAGNELKERAGEDFFNALYAAIPAPAGAKLEMKFTNTYTKWMTSPVCRTPSPTAPQQ